MAPRSGGPDGAGHAPRLAGRPGRLAVHRRRACPPCADVGGTDRDRRRVTSLAELGAADSSCSTWRPGRRRDPRGPAAGPGRPRLPPLPPRPGRVQGRPRGRGRGPWQRGLPPRRNRPPRRRLRGDRRRRARGQPRPDARAPLRPRRPAVPRRSDPLDRATSIRLGLRARARRLRRRRDRGHPGPARALRPRLPRADRRQRRPRSRRPGRYNANYVGGDIITGANTRSRSCSGPASRSTRTAPASPASTSAPRPRRPARARTGCAGSTRPGRRSGAWQAECG